MVTGHWVKEILVRHAFFQSQHALCIRKLDSLSCLCCLCIICLNHFVMLMVEQVYVGYQLRHITWRLATVLVITDNNPLQRSWTFGINDNWRLADVLVMLLLVG